MTLTLSSVLVWLRTLVTLLLVVLVVMQLEHSQAQGINLLYFLPCALPALWRYRRRKLFPRALWLWGAAGGCAGALAGALCAPLLPTPLLRRGLGLLMVALGLRELFAPPPERKKAPEP